MARGKLITEDRFDAIKTLINGHADMSAIVKAMEASEVTVKRIMKCDCFEDYLELQRPKEVEEEVELTVFTPFEETAMNALAALVREVQSQKEEIRGLKSLITNLIKEKAS